jgi:CHASE2 domain-containing sensor protein
MRYVDFDLRISRGQGDTCEVRADSETHGEEEGLLSLDTSAAEFQEDLKRLEERRTDRGFLHDFGQRLYEMLFTRDIDRLYQRSYGAVEQDDRIGMRVRLHIEPPDVSALPWELLYSAADKDYRGTRVLTPLVCYLRMSKVRRDLSTEFPLRVLVVIPQGSDETVNLDVSAERDVLQRATSELGDDVEVTFVHEQFDDHRVTWDRLDQCLNEKNYHCVHFIGHGLFRNERGYLVLDGPDGKNDFVEDSRFAKLFTNARTVKLVVLNSCKGAKGSSSRQLAGSAAKLVESGIPAVVAMQFSILDPAAVDFARAFYASLFRSDDTGRVDVAVSRGRHILEAKYGDQRELAAPVLFMRSGNGVLFVPETGKTLSDLPKSKDRLDTLEEAAEETASESEAAKFRRRVAVAKQAVRTALTVTMVVFFLSWIGFLDVFSLDTRAEFLVMGFGNSLADHPVSDDLQIVTIDCNTVPTRCDSVEKRHNLVAETIRNVSTTNPGLIALSVAYKPTPEGGFANSPQSGNALADAIREVSSPVVVGSLGLSCDDPPTPECLLNLQLRMPDSLREAAHSIGHGCVEAKLELARSLPITVSSTDVDKTWPSFALAAYAAFNNGTLLAGDTSSGNPATVSFADRPDKEFVVSERYMPAFRNSSCQVIKSGDEVSHRFIKLMPSPQAGYQQVLTSDTELSQLLAEDAAAVRDRFAGNLVLLGQLREDKKIKDFLGTRYDIFWQADAINNLLVDEAIVPLRDLYQFWLMILLAAIGVALRMRFDRRKATGAAIMTGVTAALVVGTVYTYGNFGTLLNPAYHIVALWAAWGLAGRAGRTWLR